MKFDCEYYIGTGPCAPMCTNPLYETGSGIANAYCNTCRYRMERLEAENAKMRERIYELEMEGSDHFTSRHMRRMRAALLRTRTPNCGSWSTTCCKDEERGHNDELTFYEHVERANELGEEFRG